MLGVVLLPFGRCRSGTNDDVLCHLNNIHQNTNEPTNEKDVLKRSNRNKSKSNINSNNTKTEDTTIASKSEPIHTTQERLVRRSLHTLSTFASTSASTSASPPLRSVAVSSTLDVGRLSTLLDLHIYQDATFQLGTVTTTLGDCYRDVGGEYAGKKDMFFFLLLSSSFSSFSSFSFFCKE